MSKEQNVSRGTQSDGGSAAPDAHIMAAADVAGQQASAASISTAYHEAGHAVMAYLNDHAIGNATIEGDDPHYVPVYPPDYDPFCSDERTAQHAQYTDELIMGNLAGSYAEALFDWRTLDRNQQDFLVARKLAESRCDGINEVEPYLKWLEVRVVNMLTTPLGWMAVESVAGSLQRHGRLNSEQIRAAICASFNVPEKS